MSHSPAEITRRAKSNLAFALRVLPPERRADAVTFYAFCRTIDDLADDRSRPLADRMRGLDAWTAGLRDGFANQGELETQVTELRERLAIPTDLLLAIVDGCRTDLHPQRFGTWEDLQHYSWKVACTVGLVSLRIFGARHPDSERYAVALGHALQLTNILRDIAEDLANGVRIYLPLGDLDRFLYPERDLVGRVYDGRFLALMNFEADRARRLFDKAAALLPAADRRALLPAEIMHEIYSTLLDKMRHDGFRVFDRRYRISTPRKLAILSKHLLATRGDPPPAIE